MLDSKEDNDNEEFAMINPDLVNFDVISSTHTGCETGIARATANKILPPNDHFFLEVLSVEWRATASFSVSWWGMQ